MRVTKRFTLLGQVENRTHTITNVFVLIQTETLLGAGQIVIVVRQGNSSALKVSKRAFGLNLLFALRTFTTIKN